MLEFNKEKLVKVLQREGWRDHEIEAMISLLGKVTSRLQKPFDEWMDHQVVSDEPLVEGWSIQSIMKLQKCHFLDALTIMDVYLDHPDLAKQYKNLYQRIEMNE